MSKDIEELPEGWVAATVSEVCEINPSKPRSDQYRPELPVSFVPMPAVNADQGAITNPSVRAFAEVRKGFTAFRENDVILAKITPCMENGKAAVARGLENGLGFGSTEFHVMRSSGAVLPDFIYYYIRQESFRKLAEQEMTGSVGQKRVPAEYLHNVAVPLPPLQEQKRIVAKVEEVLGRVTAARERLAKAPAILKRFRQAVLAAACSGRLTAEWRVSNAAQEPAEGLLRRLLVKPLSTAEAPEEGEPLPEAWRWVRFGDLIAELRNGLSTKPNQNPPGNPILRINAVRAREVFFDDLRYLPNTNELIPTYSLREGDLLFTRYNGSLDLLGVCGMVSGLNGRAVLYPDKLMRVRFAHGDVLPKYCELFFSEPRARDRMVAKAKSSAGQNGVSGSDVKAQPFALPPVAEQNEIVRRVDALFKLSDAIDQRLSAASQQVDKLTQAVLAKAFRGELVPTEAELARAEGRDYEPASVLLDRVRAERSAASASPKAKRRKS